MPKKHKNSTNTQNEASLDSLARLFIVVWDDQQGICAPMVMNTECAGALCAGVGDKEKIPLFQSRQAARKAIDISIKWNTLLKSQDEIYNGDFDRDQRKFIRIIECKPNKLL